MVYFAAGGLLTSARVNVVQLTVKLGGFALALPLALAAVGGWSTRSHGPQRGRRTYWTFWRGGPPGVMYLALLMPRSSSRRDCCRRVYGARDDRAVRLGVGLNALGLLLYAVVPGAARHHRARHGFPLCRRRTTPCR